MAFCLALGTLGTYAATDLENDAKELKANEYPEAVATLIRHGNYKKALQYIDEGLALNANSVQLKFQKCVVLEREGRETEAMSHYESLIRFYPEIAEPYNNLANILIHKGDYEKAEGLLKNAIRMKNSYALAYENLGKLYLLKSKEAFREAKEKGQNVQSYINGINELLK